MSSLSQYLCISTSALNREFARRNITKCHILKTLTNKLRSEGKTCEEIADILGIGVSTVYRNKD